MDDQEEIKEEQSRSSIPFVWCLVGNIIEERYFGEGKEQIKQGTKKFRPHAKVYCFPAQWGDGYEEIKVIGRTRRRKNYSTVITSSKYITNWRLQKVFDPFVVKMMKENHGWDETVESIRIIKSMLEWLPQRTIEKEKD
ncbi:hypothetical protein GE107_25865 [Cohnella sp. CFH 77786]|uniref:hypothetical protein n=1 Tax=Cohnella sp. CFH 77786 TaxID=2662265 RepID=UPI001C60D654|nr:hypothetical protein [Cohnella sp. CFH 77786]MBW5449442.1 hypothetical protein [Cohnella sp. CFH 77786]